ncbi:DUF4192 family protein [Nocardia aobensis]|uniref:DUF4192 family protein n=1 Tax=Nocardia aobensis TaxID=257277 RepID=A0ABW6NZ22_9NOCA
MVRNVGAPLSRSKSRLGTSQSAARPERAHAAALLAFSAFRRADGVLASVGLNSALDTDPEHPFAKVLGSTLRAGTSPLRLQPVVDYAHDLARTVGVDLHR